MIIEKASEVTRESLQSTKIPTYQPKQNFPTQTLQQVKRFNRKFRLSNTYLSLTKFMQQQREI